MSNDERINNCNGSERSEPFITRLQTLKFKQNFYIRTFSTGCYYNDGTNWISDGIEVLDETDFNYTYCESRHLTEFAGGFVALPPSINFDYVWSNASLLKNPFIYSTVIVITALYILLAILAKYLDHRDFNKVGVCYLKDNSEDAHYLYEIITLTGTGRNSSTNSRVSIDIIGDVESGTIFLEDTERNPFRTGGIDSFILATKT
jgi:hypothetical protein